MPEIATVLLNDVPPAETITRGLTTPRLEDRFSQIRLPGVDVLRGVAILLVLIYHVLYQLRDFPGLWHSVVRVGGLAWSGVDLFFVLSGFLIGRILLDTKSSRYYYRTFYVRRSFRILPLYFMLLLACLVRYIPMGAVARVFGSFSAPQFPWFAYFTLTQNWWMARAGNLGLGTLSPTWSLAVEEQFYLVAPFVVRKLTSRGLSFFLTIVIVGACLLRMMLHQTGERGIIAAYVLTPCRADALGLGFLVAMLMAKPQFRELLSQKRRLLYFLSSTLLGVIAWLTYTQVHLSGVGLALQYTVLCVFYAVWLVTAVGNSTIFKAQSIPTKALAALGQISYFVYLFHIPVTEIVRRSATHFVIVHVSPTVSIAVSLIGIGITLVLARLSWVHCEQPLLRLGRRFRYDC